MKSSRISLLVFAIFGLIFLNYSISFAQAGIPSVNECKTIASNSGFSILRLPEGCYKHTEILTLANSFCDSLGNRKNIEEVTACEWIKKQKANITSEDQTTVVDPKQTTVGPCIGADCTYELLEPLPGLEKVDQSMDVGKWVNTMVRVIIGIIGVLAVVMIVVGGIQYMTTDAIGKKESGKETVQGALFGVVLALAAYIILRTINPQLVSLDLAPGTAKTGGVSVKLAEELEIESDVDTDGAGMNTGLYKPIAGLLNAPGTSKVNSKGYVRMPDAPNGEYTFWPATPLSERCGRPELVNSLYTVALNWAKKHPNEKLVIGDLNATGHLSHTHGVDVDIFTALSKGGKDTPGNFVSNEALAIELGKMFADLGTVKEIYYNVGEVQKAVNQYAKSIGADKEAGNGFMFTQKHHYNHFHIRLKKEFRGPTSSSCEGI